MPYKTDANGNNIYIPSKYAKEELPTYNEIYNEFYKEKAWDYDPDDKSHQEEDLYWRLPHRKLLLGWICNQFNKMLFEDGMKDMMIQFINENVSMPSNSIAYDIYFILDDHIPGHDEESELNYIGLPLIYTCELPKTNKRSIFASDSPSKNIKEFNKKIFLQIVIKCENSELIIANAFNIYDEIFHCIILELIKDIISYFGGDIVGWKDNDGNNIINDNGFKPGCGYDVGIDAAL